MRLLDSLAFQILNVSAGWQIYELTRDPLWLGFIGLAQGVPYIAVALWAGHAVDRADKARAIAASEAGMLLASAGLAALSLASRPPLLPLYACLAIGGLARSFQWPALGAYFQSAVPAEDYPRLAAWQTSVFQAATIAGPILGGLVYGLLGVTAAYTASAVCLAGALGLAALLRAAPPEPAEPGAASGLQEFLAGARFAFSQRVVLSAMSLDMFGVLFGGVDGVLPLFAARLGAGPAGLGVLRAAPAAGALASSLWLARGGAIGRKGAAFLGALAGYGACIVAFAFSARLLLSAALLAASGAFDGVSMVLRLSIYQELTPARLRGRVSAVNGIFIRASNQLGAFESGAAARLLGLVPSVVFGGCVTLATVAAALWTAPELRRYAGLKVPARAGT